MNTRMLPLSVRHGMALLAALLLTSVATRAEDIDIYSGSPGESALPNVLLVLDNSANWSASISGAPCYYKENGVPQDGQDGRPKDGPKANPPGQEQGTKMAIEKCALYNLIDALPVDPDGTAKFNVGLMLFNESPASNSGGYPRIAIKGLDASTKTAFKAAIRALTIGGDKGNNAAFSKTLYEAYLYLKNAPPNVGTLGTKWDPDAVSAGRYVTPSVNSCGRNYVIFLANGSPGENTNGEAMQLLANAGGNVKPIVYPTSYITNSDQANWADEFTRFMSGTDLNSSQTGTQSIITHTVAVIDPPRDGTVASNDKFPNFIDAMAHEGGGLYKSAANADDLTKELVALFNTIQAASSVFASASLPISVNSRGTYLNHIFMGMFLPDADSKPRWVGNLKQYQFSYNQVTDTLRLADSNGNPAINVGTGFIAPGAVSYWTHNSEFWANNKIGTPPSISDNPDGDIVAKGAAAQRLRDSIMKDQSKRKVFTCIGCGASKTNLTADAQAQFTSENAAVSAAALGVDADHRAELIDWVRGNDNAGDEKGPGTDVATVRPSVHGDVLHSRPAVVNYGGKIGIVAFYGANDGMLHAVVGNKEDTGIEGDEDFIGAGEMLWSFLPEEHFSKLKRLRDNSPLIKFPSTVSATAVARDYFVDGSISVYQKLDSSGDTEAVYLFVTMRRGGRVLYAFDVTDPKKPIYLWRKTSAQIPILGQTWSEPKVAKVKGQLDPVIIMGAGYDPVEDLVSPPAATMGNAVLVLEMKTGNVVTSFTAVDHPVPADVSLVDSDYDGYVDRAYAVDLGGNIYRIDFEIADAVTNTVLSAPEDWTIVKLAALGSSGGKKFFYAPDVVLTKGFTIVLAGSGDREKPLRADTQDYFYTIIDRRTAKGMDASFSTIQFSNLAPQNSSTSAVSQYGCSTALAVGEKVVNAPITIAGRTYFGTNQPDSSPDTCAVNLGLAKSYAAPLICKQPIGTELVGGGLPPSPVAGIVVVEYVDPETGETSSKHVPFIIGGDPYSEDKNGDGQNDDLHSECNKAIEGCKVTPSIVPRRSKIYWHTETER